MCLGRANSEVKGGPGKLGEAREAQTGRHRKAQRGPERPRETQRDPKTPREGQRRPKTARDAQRDPERFREAQ